MAIVSLKKSKKENTLVVARISQEVMDTLKKNNVNISRTIREYLNTIVSDLNNYKGKKKVS
jgi:hypothetical protein